MLRNSTRAKKRLGALAGLIPAVLALSAITPAEASAHTAGSRPLAGLHPNATCVETQVPVSVPGLKSAHMYGQLCTPRHPSANSRTVNLLVPGASYDHTYFDFPLNPGTYSYVTKALDAGYSTFAVDRIGTGKSTIPPSALDTVKNQTEAVHQVITDLRTGRIGHHAFKQVVWVGHSLGSEMAWYEAQKHHDVDAFVLTGLRHVGGEAPGGSANDEPPSGFIRAMDDPKFQGEITDPGYWTTAPGTRQFGFYYAPNAEQSVIDKDESLRNLTNKWELGEFATIALPANQSPSRAITVPTLLAFGDQDISYGCAATSTVACTPQAVKALEQPFYPRAELDVLIAPDSGHDIQLHKNAPQTDADILGWIKTAVRSH